MPPPANSEVKLVQHKMRRHYTQFNKQSHIPDISERPYATQPTLRANMRVNEESLPAGPARFQKRVDVPRPTTKEEVCSPRRDTKSNVSVLNGIFDGSSPVPKHRSIVRPQTFVPPEMAKRPVRAFSNSTTTLDGDLV
jgi:hypothetical protein